MIKQLHSKPLDHAARRARVLVGLSVMGASCLAAQALAASEKPSTAHAQLLQLVDQNAPTYIQVSRAIWEHPELGYHEDQSSAALQAALKQAGFTVNAGVAGEPTAFVASYGEGKPVIAILGEFDALPGLSQDTTADRKPITAGAPGHACGHNLLGSAAALAAVSLREYLEHHHIKGTLRYYGTPAEEGGSGKVYLLRAGLFDDVDTVLQWHPADHNAVANGGMLAIVSAKFTFHGIAAHAAAAPERGRSALDAVMLTGTGVEYLREHVPSNTRIHYTITKGGVAPNVVPDLAELYIMARSPSQTTLDGIWTRILKIEEGASLMTETHYETHIIGASANIIGNDVLAKVAQKNLEQVGGFRYTAEEKQFALDLQKSLPPESVKPLDRASEVQPLTPFDPNAPSASTDVGDISWNVPTIGVVTATFVPGVAAHTWQAAASAGMSIGQKGMVVAAKALTLTGADLFSNPQLLKDAHAEFQRQLQGKTYTSLIPAEQKPPLDYAF
jgi:aminobenzoyl-glutamate utilization protein B